MHTSNYDTETMFQYALQHGSDLETFTKSEIKKFCQTDKCSVFIMTGLWNVTILLNLFYKIPSRKPL